MTMGKAYKWIVDHQHYAGNDCIVWPYSRRNGYGSLGYKGEILYAHRVMCELVNGPAPTRKHQASHSCGNGHLGCTNPRHLSWKTQSENQKDRRRHGTHLGAKGSRTKFTPEQVAEIRRLKYIVTQIELARRFGVTRGCIEYWHKTDHQPAPPGSSRSTLAKRAKAA